MSTTIKEHKILSTGLHCLIDDKGRVEVYTEKEYNTISILNSWWKKIGKNYFRNGLRQKFHD